MPAKHLKRVDIENGYFHIFNRGASEKDIFRDKQDYEVFIEFLKEYLTAPAHPDTYKKEFSINGQTFKGAPYRTKNYVNDISLVAYSLEPNHFHLLLQQLTKGSLQKFMRSLSTRYSMYYNKKYQKRGSLFEGPYKSLHIDDTSSLLLLTKHFHGNLKDGVKENIDNFSSYSEYLGKRDTKWVKPQYILSILDNSNNDYFKGVGGYKNFVEKYISNNEELIQLKRSMFDKEVGHLKGSNPSLSRNRPAENPIKPIEKSKSKNIFRLFQIALTTAIYIVLFTFGLGNVSSKGTKHDTLEQYISKNINLNKITVNTQPTQTPVAQVAGDNIEITPTQTPVPLIIEKIVEKKIDKTKRTVVVVIDENSEFNSVNIRQEPAIESEVVDSAMAGDTFEFTSVRPDWYEIKLTDDSVGFIYYKFIEVVKEVK